MDMSQVSDAAKALSKIGIEIYKEDGTFNDITDTLSQLADKWDGLNDAQQSQISYALAATRQTNLLKSVLVSFKDTTDMATAAQNSDGEAMEDNKKHVDSLAGRLTILSDSWQQLKLSFGDNDSIKVAVSGLTGLLNVVNALIKQFGSLPTIGGAIAAIYGAKKLDRVKMFTLENMSRTIYVLIPKV